MTRRKLFETATAAIAATAVPATAKPQPKEWITVAHTGWNSNGHAYTPECLQKMREDAPGKPVTIGAPPNEDGDLAKLRGVVVAAITPNFDTLKIKVRWFGPHPAPVGSFICSCGTGNPKRIQGYPGHYEIDADDYRLESFMLADHSAFELAERV